VQGAFAVPQAARSDVKGRKLIVVDDVVTSGATVDVCARVLRRAGAVRVDVLSLARVVNFD
jgi:predicted amidophosphoribosyltransferase